MPRTVWYVTDTWYRRKHLFCAPQARRFLFRWINLFSLFSFLAITFAPILLAVSLCTRIDDLRTIKNQQLLWEWCGTILRTIGTKRWSQLFYIFVTCQEGRKQACNLNGLILCSSVVSAAQWWGRSLWLVKKMRWYVRSSPRETLDEKTPGERALVSWQGLAHGSTIHRNQLIGAGSTAWSEF